MSCGVSFHDDDCECPGEPGIPCGHCGELRTQADADAGRCYCRECPGCGERWNSVELAEKVDGMPFVKVCPDCEARPAHVDDEPTERIPVETMADVVVGRKR